MKKVAILQSNYIPWKGYFDIIHDVDEFIFYDEVKYTKNDWRNRNKICTQRGAEWLTIPCGKDYSIPICEVKINNSIDWQNKHWHKIKEAYQNAPFFNAYKDLFNYIYMENDWDSLSDLNRAIIKIISSEYLGIQTKFSDSSEYESHGKKTEKLISLLKSAHADYYLSGPAAKNYIDEEAFNAAGIQLAWKDYWGYPEYTQTRTPFEPSVSIIDLLVNTGDSAPYYIWQWRNA